MQSKSPFQRWRLVCFHNITVFCLFVLRTYDSLLYSLHTDKIWTRSVENYKSYETLSKTTCEVDVVQQCTEAQGVVVQQCTEAQRVVVQEGLNNCGRRQSYLQTRQRLPHLHMLGMLRFMFLTYTKRVCLLSLFLLPFLCLLLSLWLLQLYFIP